MLEKRKITIQHPYTTITPTSTLQHLNTSTHQARYDIPQTNTKTNTGNTERKKGVKEWCNRYDNNINGGPED